MVITGFPAGMFQTNCYVVAPAAGGEAVIIDPGQDAAPNVDKLLADHDLTPVAVLLTHGHLDHTWNAAPVADRYGIPTYLHPHDRAMLEDPAVGVGPTLGAMLPGITYTAPTDVRDFVDGRTEHLAGIDIAIDHAPGHTQGSVLLSVTTDDGVDVVFSGDVLFAGSIGRSDLPGGDGEQLLASIAATLLPRSDQTLVLPGHGPSTTIGDERRSNPFLAGLTPTGKDV